MPVLMVFCGPQLPLVFQIGRQVEGFPSCGCADAGGRGRPLLETIVPFFAQEEQKGDPGVAPYWVIPEEIKRQK